MSPLHLFPLIFKKFAAQGVNSEPPGTLAIIPNSTSKGLHKFSSADSEHFILPYIRTLLARASAAVGSLDEPRDPYSRELLRQPL
jgi:hypothetical protein